MRLVDQQNKISEKELKAMSEKNISALLLGGPVCREVDNVSVRGKIISEVSIE